jgi:CubicO group peptidase (beta-lactamase class C family)
MLNRRINRHSKFRPRLSVPNPIILLTRMKFINPRCVAHVLPILGLLSLLSAGQSVRPSGHRVLGPALQQIDTYVQTAMQKTGVPGVAIAVVHRDRVVYLKGFGLRKAGSTAPVDADTVFQLASLSKPIASTIVASLVGDGELSWDSRIAELDPDFRVSNNGVQQQLTIRDLLSHRSGLPTSAGDVLEDLGFSRPEILHQMRFIPLTGGFRQNFQYSNFGFTEGAIAASKAVGAKWEDLAEERLFKPLHMTSTSYRYSDYEAAINKAAIHVITDGKPVARYHRDPDAEAPAGSASSSVRDLAEWLRLQLGNGNWNGLPIVTPEALEETHSPQIPRTTNPGQRAFYGLGWNVDKDPEDRLILGHSGAFFLGAGTTVRFSPSQQIGIVVLTNALPTGLAEAIASTFFDMYNYGAPQRDWLEIFRKYFRDQIEEDNNRTPDYSKLPPPSSSDPARPLTEYVGIYRNKYYGKIEITEQRGSLWMRLPATGALYTLDHWDGDKFTYRFEAEQGIGTRGVEFTLNGSPRMTIENLALEGNGVFLRKDW